MSRIDHVAWAVRRENLERYAKLLGELFNTEFENSIDTPITSVEVWISWEAGLELVAPVDRSELTGRMVSDHLEKHGESFFAVVMGVGDFDAAVEHARSVGYPIEDVVQTDDTDARLARYAATFKKIVDLQEAPITDFLGARLFWGKVEYSHLADLALTRPAV